jgi:hypothetical protein
VVDRNSSARLSIGLGLAAVVLACAFVIVRLLEGTSFGEALLAGPIAPLLIGIGVTMHGYRQWKRTDSRQE